VYFRQNLLKSNFSLTGKKSGDIVEKYFGTPRFAARAADDNQTPPEDTADRS